MSWEYKASGNPVNIATRYLPDDDEIVLVITRTTAEGVTELCVSYNREGIRPIVNALTNYLNYSPPSRKNAS